MTTLFLFVAVILASMQGASCSTTSRHLRHQPDHRYSCGGGEKMMGGGMMMGGDDAGGMMGGMMMDAESRNHMMDGCEGMMMVNSKGEDYSACPMTTIHKLVNNRSDISRHFRDTPTGAQSKTYSATNSTETNAWIRNHVFTMIHLTHSGQRIRQCDGLFKELFDRAANIDLQCDEDNESGGVKCKYQADDDCGVGLAQAHARVVSAFVKEGWDEVHKDHANMIPDSCFDTST